MSVSGNTAEVAIRAVAIYLGIPTLIAGVIGGTLNIIAFLSLKTFRQNTCALFLTAMSFVNLGQLLFGLLSRIMINGFQAQWTDYSVGYCKCRNYLLQVCGEISYTCMCLATIDQFLATSLHVRWQQLFTIKKAHFMCVVFCIFWFLHGIPSLVWYDLAPTSSSGTLTCSITNYNYSLYIAYVYLLFLTGILPIIVTILFGFLAYWNVRQIPYRAVPLVRRALDKQLTSMVLVQVVFNIFVIVPFIICMFLYDTYNPNNTTIDYGQLNLASEVCIIIYYFYFAVSMNSAIFQLLIYNCFSVHFTFTIVYQDDSVNNYIMFLLFCTISNAKSRHIQ